MTVAVRPPEYFPRLAYCALGLVVDRFVLADTFAYSRQGYQNRCRVRTPEGALWLTVPLAAGAPGRPIAEVAIAEGERWRGRHRKTLRHHLGGAPFWAHYRDGAEALLAAEYASLAGLTAASTAWTLGALRAPAEVVRASALPGRPAALPDVLAAAGATALVTLPESAARDRAHAEAAAVPCRVIGFEERPRRQSFAGFATGCATLDLLANHGPEAAGVLRAGVGR